MDIDDPTMSSSQAMPQPTCPYRPPADAPNGSTSFQSSWSHHAHLGSSIPPFSTVSNSMRMYWGDMPTQNSQPLDSTGNGPNHQLHQTGRLGHAALSNHTHTPFTRSADFAVNQLRFQQSEESRHPIPRMPDMDRFHNSNESRQGENQSAGTMPSIPPAMPNYNSQESTMQRRNEFMQSQMARSQHDAQSNRNPRPPPTLTVQSTFFPTHLPQPNFTGNRNPPYLLQGSQGEQSIFYFTFTPDCASLLELSTSDYLGAN